MWYAPKIWDGGECWIIGGGLSTPRLFNVPENIINDVISGIKHPSAYSLYYKDIHKKHIIGVNNAYMLGSWVDVLFFGDNSWYLVHRKMLFNFRGLKVTCNSRFHNETYRKREGIKYLAKDKSRKFGLSTNASLVSWNSNSGCAAINLACHFGVKKIYLLGFDMCLDEKTKCSHWHGSHAVGNPAKMKGKRAAAMRIPPFKRHLRGISNILNDSKEMGVDIINVNLNSAIDQFPKVKLEDVL